MDNLGHLEFVGVFPFFYEANAPDRKAICELLTHFNVSDLIELHNITLAVCLQISSVQSTSTQLQILTQILRFAKFWLKLLFFEKDSRVEISCSSF